jgi:hypothetical protein
MDRAVHDTIVTDLCLKDHEGLNLEVLGFNEYVTMGRELLNKVECYQARIAFYATRVCTIRHGGISTDLYTIKDYAKALNMNHKTLSSWVLTYRNVIIKLGMSFKDVDEAAWKAANRTNNRLNWDNRRDNAEKGTPKAKAKSKGDISVEHVRKIFHEESSDTPSLVTEVRGWTSYVMQMKNNLGKRDLNLAHKGDLLELMRLLDLASDEINDFLTTSK